MSQDQRQRQLEREAVFGDGDATMALARTQERAQDGPVAYLRRYVGGDVYIEGARMNYAGVLREVLASAYGEPLALLLSPLWRVGDWGKNGISMQYAQEMPSKPAQPQWIPWGAVDGFGLAPWPLPESRGEAT